MCAFHRAPHRTHCSISPDQRLRGLYCTSRRDDAGGPSCSSAPWTFAAGTTRFAYLPGGTFVALDGSLRNRGVLNPIRKSTSDNASPLTCIIALASCVIIDGVAARPLKALGDSELLLRSLFGEEGATAFMDV